MLNRSGFLAGLLIGAVAALGADGEATLRIIPPTIEVNGFYGGADVRIEGVIEPGTQPVIVVRATGTSAGEVFNKKVRMGPVWINSGKVHTSNAPTLLLAFSHEPVSSSLRREQIDRYGLDIEAIRHEVTIEVTGSQEIDPAMREALLADYLKFKRARGFYQVHDRAITLGPQGPEGTPLSVQLRWPKTAPPGSYRVSLYECRQGMVVRQTQSSLSVVKVGFPATMMAMASNRAAFYGFLCILLAALAGFGMDKFVSKVFGKKRVVGH